MKIKTFECGLCIKLKRKSYVGTRNGLRKHLREEHGMKNQLKNTTGAKGRKLTQSHWIEHE